MMAAPDNSFGYEMEIIVPADSPIKKPADLKGHKIAFTDATSNSGFKAPSAILKADFNLEAKRDFEPVFSGKHDNSILGVVNKDYEAAAVANSVLNRMIDRKVFDPAKIRSIYKSRDLPDHRLRLRLQPRSEAGREDQGGVLQLPLGGLGARRPSSRRKASSSRSTTRRTGPCCARSTRRPASNTLASRRVDGRARGAAHASDQGSGEALPDRRPGAQGHRPRRARRPGDGADRAVRRRQVDRHPLHQPAGRADRRHGHAQRHRAHHARPRRPAPRAAAHGHDLPGVRAGRAA